MAEIKELLKIFTKEDYATNVDLHVHSCYSDGIEHPEALVQQAKEKGYKHIAICDHNTVKAYHETNILNEEIVIPAVEFDCWFHGVLIHVLGYGIDVHNEELLSLCAKTKRETEVDIIRFFSYRDPRKVIQAIHNAGGIASLAHPACCWCFYLDGFVKKLQNMGLDAIEAYYPYKRHRGIIKFHLASTPLKLAKKHNLLITGGTDNHEKI